MSEQMNNNIEEQEIDLIKLITDLWARRVFIFKGVGIGIIVGLVVAFSIPKEYTSEAKLVPEFSSGMSSKMSRLSSFAALAGLSTMSGNSGDAISPNLYPDVVGSMPFITRLFDMEVTTMDGELTTTLYDYMQEHQKVAWWSHIIAAPFRLLGAVIKLFVEPELENSRDLNVEMLTRDQYRVYKALSKRIMANVDEKTYIITVSSKMQDPQITLDVSKVVMENLQELVVNYRTRKAKMDLEYAKNVSAEAEAKYYEAQSRYATFEDENKNISSARYRTELEKLRNDMNLAFSLYTSLASNLESAKLKVQEQTPVYAVIDPATRPTDDAEPNKPMVLIAFTFLAGIISVGYLVFRDKLIEF